MSIVMLFFVIICNFLFRSKEVTKEDTQVALSIMRYALYHDTRTEVSIPAATEGFIIFLWINLLFKGKNKKRKRSEDEEKAEPDQKRRKVEVNPSK